MVKRSKNALFSFTRAMLPGHLRQHGSVERRKRISWDRLSREKRRKVAIAAGVSESIAGVWAKIRWRDIPDGWHDALISNLGAARNPMKKSKRKKKKNAARKVVRRTSTRKKKNSRPRRRNRTVTFPIPVTPAQKKKVQRFLTSLTGRRVKMK
jgi:hypothetical protein